jgi:hypothetical protein
MDVSLIIISHMGSGTHVFNWTVCVVHIDRNAGATVIDESEGVGCQDEGNPCHDGYEEQSEHINIASVMLERSIGGGMKVSLRCI